MLHQRLHLGVVILLTTLSNSITCCSSCSGKSNPSQNSVEQQMQHVYYPSTATQPQQGQVVQYPPQTQQQQPVNKPSTSKSNSQLLAAAASAGKIPINLVPDIMIFELLLTSPLWSSLSNSIKGCILNKLETEVQSSLKYLITEADGSTASALQQLTGSAAVATPPFQQQPPSAGASQVYGYQIAGQQSPSSYMLAVEQPIVSSQNYVPSSGSQTIQNGYGAVNQGSPVYSSPSSSNVGYQQTNAVY